MLLLVSFSLPCLTNCKIYRSLHLDYHLTIKWKKHQSSLFQNSICYFRIFRSIYFFNSSINRCFYIFRCITICFITKLTINIIKLFLPLLRKVNTAPAATTITNTTAIVAFIFLFTYSGSKLVFCVGGRRRESGSVFSLFYIFSFRYWFSEKSRYLLSTGVFYWLTAIIYRRFPSFSLN